MAASAVVAMMMAMPVPVVIMPVVIMPMAGMVVAMFLRVVQVLIDLGHGNPFAACVA